MQLPAWFQALPPQVWNSLQDSAGEVLQAMASAVDKAMDNPGMPSHAEAPPPPLSSGSHSSNVTCIAMPMPLSSSSSAGASSQVFTPFFF